MKLSTFQVFSNVQMHFEFLETEGLILSNLLCSLCRQLL